MRFGIKCSPKKTVLLIGCIFAVVGIAFLTAGGLVWKSRMDFMDRAETTDAVITDISVDSYRSNGKNRNSRSVFISYSVDGEEYARELNEYNSNMYVGQHITIYYDPENPGDVITDSLFLPVFFSGMGGLFALLGCIFIPVTVRSLTKRKKLLEKGDLMTGIITGITENTKVRINGCHPFKVECQVTDPFNGEKYLYSSENTTEDMSGFIGQEVDVYVSKNNKADYYVDINGLVKKYQQDNGIHDYR